MLQQRSCATVILLSLVTCGIYALYWGYVTIYALDEAGGASNMTPGIQFLLLFFGVGWIILGINADANVNAIKEQRGIPTQDNKVLWLILPLIGIGTFIQMGLIQSEINKLAA